MLKLAKDSLCPVCRIRPGLAIYYDKCEDCYIEPNAAHIRELYAEPDGSAEGAEGLLLEAVAGLPLAPKIVSQLGDEDILYLYQLVRESEADLLEIKNVGDKTITAINEALASVGLKLKEE